MSSGDKVKILLNLVLDVIFESQELHKQIYKLTNSSFSNSDLKFFKSFIQSLCEDSIDFSLRLNADGNEFVSYINCRPEFFDCSFSLAILIFCTTYLMNTSILKLKQECLWKNLCIQIEWSNSTLNYTETQKIISFLEGTKPEVKQEIIEETKIKSNESKYLDSILSGWYLKTSKFYRILMFRSVENSFQQIYSSQKLNDIVEIVASYLH